jgi:hypothetical protein
VIVLSWQVIREHPVVVTAPERRGKGKGAGLSKNRYIAGVSTPQRPNFLDQLRDTLDDDEVGFYQVRRKHSVLGLRSKGLSVHISQSRPTLVNVLCGLAGPFNRAHYAVRAKQLHRRRARCWRCPAPSAVGGWRRWMWTCGRS